MLLSWRSTFCEIPRLATSGIKPGNIKLYLETHFCEQLFFMSIILAKMDEAKRPGAPMWQL
jgi:hypothetical protein